MLTVTPSSQEELAQALRSSAAAKKTIRLVGNDSKREMGGPICPSDTLICTSGLRRVLEYQPRDLTISVEAGLPFSELQRLVAQNRQMIALDPPLSSRSTIGGVVGTNGSGPMRRSFGTARDLVIGMSFAMLDGRLIKAGGMVVKNVAGLDMGKLLIGSFGTLAVMTSINLRLHSLPFESRTFLFSFSSLEPAMEKRNWLLKSVLQPVAVDLLSPAVASRIDRRGYLLAIRVAGTPLVIARYAKELAGAEQLSGTAHAQLWRFIREFTPNFLSLNSKGVVLRVSSSLKDISAVMAGPAPSISRAGSGISYVYLFSAQQIEPLWKAAEENQWSIVVEFAPDDVRQSSELWRLPSSDPGKAAFAMMKQVKQMFDPHNLLNRLRLYGRI